MAAADYGSAAFWDERYEANPAPFDWYNTYQNLKPILRPFLSTSPDFEVLVPGCGSSTLSADLYDDGYRNVTSLDISGVVVEQLAARYGATREEMEFAIADATDLRTLPDACFDLVVDKGLGDALLCSTRDGFGRLHRMLGEMRRVLKPGGTYACVSHAVPARRLELLRAVGWSVDYRRAPKPPTEGGFQEDGGGGGPHGGGACHYVYLCSRAFELTAAQKAARAAYRRR